MTGSIGYGKTLPEVALAMRLSKAQGGNSIMGIGLRDSGKINETTELTYGSCPQETD
ncbi:hypothetical protein [Lyngbya aestuarii]|uniref:hypothetical protein n=1 Tax=Lyngbya aestuarii TaxID=118322 RepID=UPI0023AA1DAF|nr:hypothetical protein [Lyngbya aestuarii]